MLSHEFIKQLATELMKQQAEPDVSPNQAVLVQVEPETEDLTDKKTMVGPLQQKLELLKKAVDVDSYFDANNPGYDPGPDEGAKTPDEVEQLKRLAGVMHAAGDDDPLES